MVAAKDRIFMRSSTDSDIKNSGVSVTSSSRSSSSGAADVDIATGDAGRGDGKTGDNCASWCGHGKDELEGAPKFGWSALLSSDVAGI